jgi:hypothetical protein
MTPLPGYIRAWRLNNCTYSSSIRTQCPGLWSPPTVTPTRSCHGEGATTPRAHHGVNRQGEVGLHPHGTDSGNNTFNPSVNATLVIAPPATPSQPTTWTTCSGRHIHFSACFNIWANISMGGVMWQPPTIKQALHNQRSPWQLQHPFFCEPPSDKSIKMRAPNTLASVIATLTSREYCNCKSSSSKQAADSASICQYSTGQLAAAGASPSSWPHHH